MIHRDRCLAYWLSAPAQKKLEKPSTKNHSTVSGASSHFESLSDGLNSHNCDLILFKNKRNLKMVTLRTLLKLQVFSPPTSAIPFAFLTPLHLSDCLCYGSPVPFCPSHYPATISRTQVTGVNDLSGDTLGVSPL